MDIKQALNAIAVVTLGKDMTFRDYAQVRKPRASDNSLQVYNSLSRSL